MTKWSAINLQDSFVTMKCAVPGLVEYNLFLLVIVEIVTFYCIVFLLDSKNIHSFIYTE